MGWSFRTCLLLTAFQELSGLQQKVHHLLLGPRKSLPMASKGCLFLLFSVCCAILFVLSYSQDSGKVQSLLPLSESVSPRIQQLGHGREQIYFLLLSQFFKKGTGNMVSNYTANKQCRGHLFPCNLVLNLQCQERAHLYVEN